MAVLTTSELSALRREVAAEGGAVDYTKPTINAALQAIEDWFEANRANLGAAVEAAAPGSFNAAAKKRLVKFWLRQKFGRE